MNVVEKTRLQIARERLGNKCVVCGSTENLEFDHVEPGTRLFTIPAGVTGSLIRFLAEVDKCQLLCEEHHNAKTRLENGQIQSGVLEGRTHGLMQTYHQGCRCEECRQANANRRYLNKLGLSSV